MEKLGELVARQDGVVSRTQALESGLTATDVNRMVRRREWRRVHTGVYVNHTGPLTWRQRAWAAVLACAPAALSHESALRAVDGPGRQQVDETVHVAVDRHRHVTPPAGVRLHRRTNLAERALWNVSPPRMRPEEVVLDLAEQAKDELEAVAVIADACRSRRTTAARLSIALGTRRRFRRRDWLASVLVDVAEGTCSVLEHGYLARVERAHGLPRAQRQLVARGSSGRVYRDAEYAPQRLVVELDGRLFHDSAVGRDRDLERDLDAALTGRRTVRLGYGQVFRRPCRTAATLARLLGTTLRPCPQCGGSVDAA